GCSRQRPVAIFLTMRIGCSRTSSTICASNMSRPRRSSLALALFFWAAGSAACRWKQVDEQRAPAQSGEAPPSFAVLVKRVMPAVVGVYTTTRDLEQSLGSGVIIDRDGQVLTNSHVIAERGEIQVRFHDGHRAPAHLIGRDEDTDLALLKI